MSTETKQPNYWKSLNELAQNEEYKKYLEREFPENATELNDDVSRRSFLRVMGASIALAGFAACRRPVQKIMPYSKQPEDLVQGEPLHYATAMPFKDSVTGLLVETHEGRPTKIEGNEQHPASNGNTNTFQQGAVLGLYDPDRSRYIRQDGNRSSWNDFSSFCREQFQDTDQKIAFIAENNSSPTFQRLKNEVLNKFPESEWVTYEPFGEENRLEGHKLAFDQKLRSVRRFDQADVIVSLDDDFLNPAANKNNVQGIARFTERRAVESTDDDMSRLFSVESTFSLTGSNADNRLRLPSSQIERFTYALAARLSRELDGLEAFSQYSNEFSQHHWINVLTDELLNSRERSLVTAGNEHAPEVHAAVAAINYALQNNGSTITYHSVPHIDEENQRAKFARMIEDMNNGQYDAAVIIGTNPVFTAPSDINVEQALQNTSTTLHLSNYYNETSQIANWHVNRAHFLEAWGDGFSFDGTRSIIQPLISPLYSGKSELEFLAAVGRGKQVEGYEMVRQTWQSYYPDNFENTWEKILHDGVDTEGHFPEENAMLSPGFATEVQQFITELDDRSGIELVIRPDTKVYDGRFANNGWLQELPEPMTKNTWDNVALMSPNTADQLGVQNEDLIEISTGEHTIKLPVWKQPGHADNSITTTVGQGRTSLGRVANETGFNTYPARTTAAPHYHSDVSVKKLDSTYEIANTQDHHSMEGRPLLRETTLQNYRENPEFASYEHAHGGAELPGKKLAEEKGEEFPIPLFEAQEYPDHEPQWGMSIDLNACIGCGTCTIACQAENNIPVVGKREVRRGREMHWIRTDRYFKGDNEENPEAYHQPVPCMHCEIAPCEQVCPVAATTHSDDGMNQMTYNRCIGTRYCANNCPYKVRRFNFFNYSREFLTSGSDPEIVQMAMNPDVTIRFRGVMEKCTYCVQRVNRAKVITKKKSGSVKPPDGMVETACQQACPTDAISFGDLTDRTSKVSEEKMNERTYILLEELNTRPRTSYMAKLRNPNPELA